MLNQGEWVSYRQRACSKVLNQEEARLAQGKVRWLERLERKEQTELTEHEIEEKLWGEQLMQGLEGHHKFFKFYSA